MESVVVSYLIRIGIRIVLVLVALGIGLWYVGASIDGDAMSYTNMDTFINAVGVTDGNIANANGCFLCSYVNELFAVLGIAAEKFWAAILQNLWILMVTGFGIFLFIHTIKYFYKAMTDAASMGGGTSGDKSSAKSSPSKSAGSKDTGSVANKVADTVSKTINAAKGTEGASGETKKYKYAQLAWLASNGHHNIDTRIKPTNATGIKVKFNVSGSGDYVVTGLTTRPRNVFEVRVAGNMFLPFDEDMTTGGNVGVAVTTNSDYEVSINYMNDRKRYVNGISKLDITNTLSTDFTGGTICLFVAGGMYGNAFPGRVYYLQITEGQSLVRNLVPVQKFVNGELKGDIGMYDLISHEFYPGLSTGKFTAGPVVGYLEEIKK